MITLNDSKFTSLLHTNHMDGIELAVRKNGLAHVSRFSSRDDILVEHFEIRPMQNSTKFAIFFKDDGLMVENLNSMHDALVWLDNIEKQFNDVESIECMSGWIVKANNGDKFELWTETTPTDITWSISKMRKNTVNRNFKSFTNALNFVMG